MTYTTIKRYNRKGIGGDFNIPWGTPLEKRDDGMLYYDGKPVCVARSFASHEHFCRDDDGQGAARGKLSHAIIKALGGYHRETTPEWEAVWNDETANSYRRKDHGHSAGLCNTKLYGFHYLVNIHMTGNYLII